MRSLKTESGRWRILTLVVAILLFLPLMARGATFREFSAWAGVYITPGPDGAMWFTQSSFFDEYVGRISLAGAYSKVDVGGSLPKRPLGIAAAPDGTLWVTDRKGSVLRRRSISGEWSEFPIPSPAEAVTLGPDGNVWFTMDSTIGRMTAAGEVQEFPVPTPSPWLGTITAGPDGNLWFAERAGDKIGRITPSGQITEFPLADGRFPFSIVVGPDNHLWFTEYRGNRIGRISTNGKITEFELPHPGSLPAVIVPGPDGNLWFTEQFGDRIGRITTAGMITELDVPTPDAEPTGLAFGADGNLWFVYGREFKVTRMTLGGTAVNGPCVTSDTILCIDDVPGDRRFQVEVEYQTVQGGGLSGKGRGIPLASLGVARGGLFWFFSADNPEIVIKVLNGCESNQKYWVFASGGTNVGMTITVSDTVTGEVHTYYNHDLTPFAPIQDVNALSCGD